MVISRTNTYPFRVQFRSKLPRLLLAHFAGFPNQREINCLPNSNPMLRDREPRILPRMAAHEPDDHRSSKLCTKRWNEKNQRIAITFLPKCFRHSLLFGGRKRVKSSLPLKGKDYPRPALTIVKLKYDSLRVGTKSISYSFNSLLIIPINPDARNREIEKVSRRLPLSFEVLSTIVPVTPTEKEGKNSSLEVSGSSRCVSSRACHPLAGARVETYDHELASYARCPCRE